MRKTIIKKGDKFNKLTAIEFSHKDKRYKQYWLFRCDCGSEKVIRVDHIKSGRSKSCGCLNVESKIRHGMYKTRTYCSWGSMIQRCFNKSNPEYKNYGGRGIIICKEWMKFENFFEDMKSRPQGKSLDRKNNNLGYCKSNCCWSTPKKQANNKRNNHLLIYKGKTQNITQWAKELSINRQVIYNRINNYNWSIEKALEI